MRWLAVVLTAPAVAFMMLAAAIPQEPTPQAGSGEQAPPAPPEEKPLPPPLLPSQYAAGEPSAPVQKALEAKPKKVFAAIVAALEQAGVPVETADETTGYIKTQLMLFEHTRFHDVATPPVIMSKERPIRSLVRLNQGKFSVEFQTERKRAGTQLTVRAYIEESAFHMGEHRRVWIERYSNGVIEKYFIERIEKALSP